jgi:putative membrane protein
VTGRAVLAPPLGPGPLSGRWSRLHPLSPLPRFAAPLGVLVLVLLPGLTGSTRSLSGAGSGVDSPSVIELAAVGAAMLMTLGAATVSWVVTRWRVVGDELQIDTGLFVRQSLRFPLRRIQAVDIVAPLTARAFGLAEVRVISAGSGRHQRGRLAYLRNEEAALVRAQLLALAHGLAAETPEPPALPVFQVDNGRLIAASLLRGPVYWALLLFLPGILVYALGPGGASSSSAASLVSTLLTTLFAVVLDAARFVNTDYDFAIGEAPDGLRLHRGLLQKRHETVLYGRIQAVRLVQPLLWRPFGWARVELDVARQAAPRERSEARQLARMLAPVATRREAEWIIARLFPGAPLRLVAAAGPPRRALLRAPLSFHYLRAWHDGRYVVTQTGRVRPAVVVIPLEKVQSIRWKTGPLLRALRLASLRVDTAGRRWVGEALCRDEEEASSLFDELGALARQARRTLPRAAPGGPRA